MQMNNDELLLIWLAPKPLQNLSDDVFQDVVFCYSTAWCCLKGFQKNILVEEKEKNPRKSCGKKDLKAFSDIYFISFKKHLQWMLKVSWVSTHAQQYKWPSSGCHAVFQWTAVNKVCELEVATCPVKTEAEKPLIKLQNKAVLTKWSC